MMAPLSQPPPLPLPPPLVPPLQKSAQQILCGTHCTLSHCLSALLISSIPAILLLLLAMLKTLRSCWRCGAVDAQRQQFGPPKQHRSRDRSLWLAALVSAVVSSLGAPDGLGALPGVTLFLAMLAAGANVMAAFSAERMRSNQVTLSGSLNGTDAAPVATYDQMYNIELAALFNVVGAVLMFLFVMRYFMYMQEKAQKGE